MLDQNSVTPKPQIWCLFFVIYKLVLVVCSLNKKWGPDTLSDPHLVDLFDYFKTIHLPVRC